MTDEALAREVEAIWADPAARRSDRGRAAGRAVLAALDVGRIRVAERIEPPDPAEMPGAAETGGDPTADSEPHSMWHVHTWVKQGILLYFQNEEIQDLEAGPLHFRDKIPIKRDLAAAGVRVVPPGVARYGSFLEPGVILMPGYVNVGARVGQGSMVDTWATVGSCAQIGRGVHLSGGVGIGGVLEPPQAQPVIIEDHAFIGSRSIVVEGAIVEEGAVLGAGVVITASTPILDVTASEVRVLKGRVPRRSVVIPGTWPRSFPAGTYQVPCALIIGTRRASTDEKTSLENALREYDVAV